MDRDAIFYDTKAGRLRKETSMQALIGRTKATTIELLDKGFKRLTATPALIEHWEETFDTTW